MKLLILFGVCLSLVKAISFSDLFGNLFGLDKNNDIVVTWITLQDTKESRVQYGESTMNLEATGSSIKFEKAQGQFIHRVTLKDLKYDTKYVYHCGSQFGWSELFEFKTPRASSDAMVRALIFGDMGVENAHLILLVKIAAGRYRVVDVCSEGDDDESICSQALPYLQDECQRDTYDFVLHVGDLAYDLYEDHGERGNKFLRQIQPFAAIKPYMTVPGNHEYHGDNSESIYHYKAKFSMPSFEKQGSLYYSWNIGPVHFVGVNTEAWWEDWPIETTLGAHFSWLIGDLENASKPENRKQRPWIILYGHRPMYCSNEADIGVCQQQYTRIGIGGGMYAMEPLLKKYGVDVAIWAHEHSYERTWPLFDNKVYNGSSEHPYVNPGAPVHLITGSAGCREQNNGFINKPEEWSAFRSTDYGYTRFHAYNHSHIYFEQTSVFGHNKGKVIDSFWVVKEVHAAYDI